MQQTVQRHISRVRETMKQRTGHQKSTSNSEKKIRVFFRVRWKMKLIEKEITVKPLLEMAKFFSSYFEWRKKGDQRKCARKRNDGIKETRMNEERLTKKKCQNLLSMRMAMSNKIDGPRQSRIIALLLRALR